MNDFDNDAIWLTTVRAAEFLGLATMTLHNYRHHGKGPACESNGKRRWFYHVDALRAWDAERRQKVSAAKAKTSTVRKPRKATGEARAAA